MNPMRRKKEMKKKKIEKGSQIKKKRPANTRFIRSNEREERGRVVLNAVNDISFPISIRMSSTDSTTFVQKQISNCGST